MKTSATYFHPAVGP